MICRHTAVYATLREAREAAALKNTTRVPFRCKCRAWILVSA